MTGDDGEHGFDDALGRDAQLFQFVRTLDRPQPFQREGRVLDLAEAAPCHRPRIHRKEGEFGADAFALSDLA